MLNPKEREVSPLNGNWLLMRNVCAIPNGMKKASSVRNDYQTHTRVRNWWKKLKKHEFNSFSS